jgi:polyisoprenoid-binding protein YceI
MWEKFYLAKKIIGELTSMICRHLLYLSILTWVSCKQAPKGVPAEHSQAQDVIPEEEDGARLLHVDTQASKIIWKGTKIGGWHAGEIKLQDGRIRIKEDMPVSGEFHINMNSIVNTDIPDSDPVPKKKIVDHLKGPDFFDVEQYPLSTFQITAVSATDQQNKIKLSGNLTLRGVNRNITFLADVEPGEDSLRAFADFNIDRQQWGVSYRGPKDQLVHDQVNLKLIPVATNSL